MKLLIFFLCILIPFAVRIKAQEKQKEFSFRKSGKNERRALTATSNIQVPLMYKQGFQIQAWLGNNATIGLGASPDFSPPDGIGVEYPVGSGIEHLYGGGPWIGAIIDTGRGANRRRIKAVSTGYGGRSGGFTREMFGHQSPSDTFYRTSIYLTNQPNRRMFDDDGDGKIDEDDLDGIDNDRDWNIFVHDLGADGLPDSLEYGCRGGYHPIDNPDPAFDNYQPQLKDLCREGFPLKNDINIYTQNNGKPDVGEPNVDEDYGAVSESDVYISYIDYYSTPIIAGHVPLGIMIWQKSYAWVSKVRSPIIFFEYIFVNKGNRTLDSVYLGWFADTDVGPRYISGYYTRNFSGYLHDVRTAYAHNAVDRPSTPIGVTILGTPKPLNELKYTFQWHPIQDNPQNDEAAYNYMSSGEIKPDEPVAPGSDTQFFFGFGPFDAMKPNDSLKITIALLSGDGISEGNNNLHDNAVTALEIYNRGYTLPEVPPSPPLRIEKGHNLVKLNWKWQLGDPKFDPIETWDDSNKFVSELDSTHWRRRNPPPGKIAGGRIFEGFRVWRSEAPEFNPHSFALLQQFDVDDDLGFEYGTGLQFDYIDSHLVRGKKYWYSVTSFSIPGALIIQIPDTATGEVRFDTLITEPVESDISENATLVQLPFEPSNEVGKVKVVPNPYRTDIDYSLESGGWEGLGRFWNENKRVIWFIHLPPKCVIRIFSLTGDLITTINHDDATRITPDKPVGQEEWNLISHSGRAIASGVYVFTVESDFGRQIGKFVVIR